MGEGKRRRRVGMRCGTYASGKQLTREPLRRRCAQTHHAHKHASTPLQYLTCSTLCTFPENYYFSAWNNFQTTLSLPQLLSSPQPFPWAQLFCISQGSVKRREREGKEMGKRRERDGKEKGKRWEREGKEMEEKGRKGRQGKREKIKGRCFTSLLSTPTYTSFQYPSSPHQPCSVLCMGSGRA